MFGGFEWVIGGMVVVSIVLFVAEVLYGLHRENEESVRKQKERRDMARESFQRRQLDIY